MKTKQRKTYNFVKTEETFNWKWLCSSGSFSQPRLTCQRPLAGLTTLSFDVCDSEMFSFIGTEEKSPQQLNNKYKHVEVHRSAVRL